METKTYHGQCHCGAIVFTIEAAGELEVQRCNCSICRMCGFLHLIVPQSCFHLLSGEEDLSCYKFNTETARHLFCKHCGIKAFYIPRSNPDGYSVNLNCLAEEDIDDVAILNFDGKNWEQHSHTLRHLSKK